MKNKNTQAPVLHAPWLALGCLLLIGVSIAAGAPPAGRRHGRPFVVTEPIRAENGITIPAGTEVLVEGDPTMGVLSVTLNLNAAPETVAAKLKPITEERDFLVLSYWVAK